MAARPLEWRCRPTSPSWTRSLAVCRRVHPRWPQRRLQKGDPRLNQRFRSLRLGHWRISWARRYGGSRRGPTPLFLYVTTNGRDRWIKIEVWRRLWRWQIWTRRCRRSAGRYEPTFLGSSRQAPRAVFKLPPSEISPLTRKGAAAKGSHGVTAVPRCHRRLQITRRHRRQPTRKMTSWGARWNDTVGGPCVSGRSLPRRPGLPIVPPTQPSFDLRDVAGSSDGMDCQEHDILLRGYLDFQRTWSASRSSSGSEGLSRPAMKTTRPRRWVCTSFPTSFRATLKRRWRGTYRGRVLGANGARLDPSSQRSTGFCRPTRSRTLWNWHRTRFAGRRSWIKRGWTPLRHTYGALPSFAATSSSRERSCSSGSKARRCTYGRMQSRTTRSNVATSSYWPTWRGTIGPQRTSWHCLTAGATGDHCGRGRRPGVPEASRSTLTLRGRKTTLRRTTWSRFCRRVPRGSVRPEQRPTPGRRPRRHPLWATCAWHAVTGSRILRLRRKRSGTSWSRAGHLLPTEERESGRRPGSNLRRRLFWGRPVGRRGNVKHKSIRHPTRGNLGHVGMLVSNSTGGLRMDVGRWPLRHSRWGVTFGIFGFDLRFAQVNFNLVKDSTWLWHPAQPTPPCWGEGEPNRVAGWSCRGKPAPEEIPEEHTRTASTGGRRREPQTRVVWPEVYLPASNASRRHSRLALLSRPFPSEPPENPPQTPSQDHRKTLLRHPQRTFKKPSP